MLSLIFIITQVFCDTLLQSQVVFRHGSRNAIYKTQTFPYPDYEMGELTAMGIRQTYLLGQWLSTAILNSYDQNKVYVRSTNLNRTIMSAQSLLLGLFPIGSGPLIEDNMRDEDLIPTISGITLDESGRNANYLQYQAVPVYVFDHSFILSGYTATVCPIVSVNINQNINTTQYKNIELLFENTKQSLNQLLGTNKSLTLQDLHQNFDNFISLKYNSYDLPQISDDLWYNLSVAYNLYSSASGYLRYGQASLYSSAFFQDLLNNMDNIINNQSNLSLIINSAHDSTLVLLLNSLNFTNWRCLVQQFTNKPINLTGCIYTYPLYTANLIFELWSSEKGQYVQILYNGTVQPICGNLSCPYSQFKQIIQSKIVDQPKLCSVDQKFVQQVNSKVTDSYKSLFFGSGISIFIGFCFFNSRKQKQSILLNSQ